MGRTAPVSPKAKLGLSNPHPARLVHSRRLRDPRGALSSVPCLLLGRPSAFAHLPGLRPTTASKAGSPNYWSSFLMRKTTNYRNNFYFLLFPFYFQKALPRFTDRPFSPFHCFELLGMRVTGNSQTAPLRPQAERNPSLSIWFCREGHSYPS